MEALCDSCIRVFTVVPAARKEGDIETTYFTCAHCGREYVVCRTDSDIRNLQSRIDRQRRRNGERQRQGELTKRHIGHLQRKAKALGDQLDALNRAE